MSSKNIPLIVICFANIYIVWGSTYLFADFAIEQIPAFLLCGYRYIIAGLLTLGLARLFSGRERPSIKELLNAVFAGFLFMGLGTGGAIWALNHLDTGFTALIISGEPLLVVILMWLLLKRKPGLITLGGILLSMIGMYLLVSQQELVATYDQWFGVLVIFLSMVAWGLGSIFVSRASLPKAEFINSGIQMLTGGISTLVISCMIGETGESMANYTSLTWISLWYLIIFGSVVAFTSFNYLLRTVSTEKVVTNTYVNPIIAMFLGFYFNDELITLQSMVAALVMLFGVFIINSFKSKKAPEETSEADIL